ncbi:hypothetical protein GCM10027445_41800 [Amycolatopsis endophytica]|uniref:Small integral membrane protein n=1 Tax=Amycolatopsis endophytica TaxID=860233 RepID=A0A853B6G8_9PSEU|nr:hypothetical protein [Amycolatopsis endophytica]NYI90590.1 hypothetical protein [Amycolatopsis endophytica]
MTDLSAKLWNEAVRPRDYAPEGEKYQNAVLEQYKICVEMADRVSARRNLTNTFFLTVNTAVGAAFVGLAGGAKLTDVSVWVLLVGLVILLGECAAWLLIVRSYRQLNSAKYAVIGAMEERLPAYAYSRAEWTALGEGRDWRRYVPLSHVEQWIPVIFALTYVLVVIALAVS